MNPFIGGNKRSPNIGDEFADSAAFCALLRLAFANDGINKQANPSMDMSNSMNAGG